MMSANWVCLTLPILLAACDGAADPQPEANASQARSSEPSEAEASMDQRVRDAVLARLRDADSAKFRNVRKLAMFGEGTSDGPAVYCGEVNAKNAMGGYPGFVHFAVMPLAEDGQTSTGKDPVSITDRNDPASALAYMSFCQDEKGDDQEGQPVQF
jgi:hypothetical protein